MDANYTYPQLFDDTFDADLFHGLHLQDDNNNNNNMYNLIDNNKKNSNNNNNNNDASSYLHYLQSNTTNTNTSNNTNTHDFFYNTPSLHPHVMNMPAHSLNMDMLDYDYLQQPSCSTSSSTDHQRQQLQQQQQYNWLYDSFDSFLPQQSLFCDETMMSNIMAPTQQHPTSFDCIMSENDLEENITVEGGMSRGYVSLSDVNSFVAKADSAKHSCLLQIPSMQDNLLMDEFPLPQQPHLHQHPNRDFMSSSESTNEDSEDEYSDNNSDLELRWPLMQASSFSTPTSNAATSASVGASIAAAAAANKANARQKLMIKIKKSPHGGLSAPNSANLNSALPSPYGEHLHPNHNPWDLISPKVSKSTGCRNTKYRKSMSNIYNTSTQKKKNSSTKFDNKGRRGSAPHRLTLHSNNSSSSLASLHSSSSLSSLSNTLQRSMRVSDSISSFMSRQSSDEEEEEEEDHEHLVEEEDDDDDEFQIRSTNAPNHSQNPTKKGRNVDKACNHCKRSHLRCDDMRPCRRCVATGKTGCKDVQHKPRGRPKLHKK